MILSAFDFCDFSLCPLQMSITVDGFDSAKIGVMSRAGQDDIFVYDYQRCIAILMERDQLSEEDAEEWMEVNVVSAWIGDWTPGFVRSQ